MIDQKYIDLILDTVDLQEVVSDYGVQLKVKGHRAWGCCPFHNENTASFCVDTAKNLWFCHGACHEGGNVITFVMKKENLPFPLAVKKLLKEKKNISLPDTDLQTTPEEEEKHKKKESMRIINAKLCSFFAEEIQKDTSEAIAARAYMHSRWDKEFCNEQQIGFAPDDWSSVVDFAIKTGLSLDLMQEMGILKMSEKSDKLYCVYKNRLMIPIRDRYSNIEGFTARALDDTAERKYINSSDSLLYDKSQSIFGIDAAIKAARQEEKLYLVEGGPDVVKLQSLGIHNTIASLGASWTKEQFQMLKDFRLKNCTLCFIPDSDIPKDGETLGAGFKNVLRNGVLATQQGFTVSVKEIPNDLDVEHPKKLDPDEYINDKAALIGLQEKEFLIWCFLKKLNKQGTTEEKQKVVEEVCDLLLLIKNEDVKERYIAQLSKIDGNKTIWHQALNSAKMREQRRKSEKNKESGIDMLRTFGFMVQHGCYYGYDKHGEEIQLSNFTLRPLFHIKDDIQPVRLFEINNTDPSTPPEIIELDMDVITSAKSFRKKLLGIGNYTWLAGEEHLIQLQRFLAQVTETAVEVKQLGWQKQGFYCFCNGAYEDGEWHEVDEYGIVRLNSGNFYLPAMSSIYKNSVELYANERKFRHMQYSSISLHDYFQKIIQVHGDNAMVGLCFYMATLFRDIVKIKARCFPILDLFGPKGSGKTELGHSLMSFFISENDPPSIASDSLPALSDVLSSYSNALVEFDEYSNDIDFKRVEWLKGLWAGIGRSKMNIDKKEREQARVDSGVIITGQEMPTADIALFTRLIYLTYDRQHHTQEERERWKDLVHYRLMGATHITLEILSHRDKFEACFDEAWKKAEVDLSYRLKGYDVMDRIERNWYVPLSAYLALEDVIKIPFRYEALLDFCVKCVIRQNDLCSKTDEVSGFWRIISSAQQKGTIMNGQHYVIKGKKSIKTNAQKEAIEFGDVRQILMIRKDIMLTTYRELGKKMDDKLLSTESMLHYLQISSEYLGVSCSPERFKKFNSNGLPIQEPIMEGNNVKGFRTVYEQDRPLCFDYKAVSEKYGVILDSCIDSVDDKPAEPVETEIPFGQSLENAPF